MVKIESNQDIIEATVTRKPNGAPLCVEILLNPDQLNIPPVVESIEYKYFSKDNEKTLIFQLLEDEDNV